MHQITAVAQELQNIEPTDNYLKLYAAADPEKKQISTPISILHVIY